MCRILDDPELKNNLRNNGLASIEKYTWNSVKRHLFAAYQQALERTGGKGAA